MAATYLARVKPVPKIYINGDYPTGTNAHRDDAEPSEVRLSV